MARKRAQKRKSEVKAEQPEENHKAEVTTNGDSSSITPNKKKKSSIKNEVTNNTPASASKKKNEAKAEKEDTTDYEVSKIIDVRYVKSNQREFLIRWKNYSPREDSWEPEENLSCDELIKAFLEDHEKQEKEPKKQLRKKPSSVQLFSTSGSGSRRSKRTGGNRKNYIEAGDGDED